MRRSNEVMTIAKSWRSPGRAAVVLFLTLFTVVACSQSDSTPTSSESSTEALEVLEMARAAMAEVQSFRVSGKIEDGRGDSETQSRLSLEYAAPDRWYQKLEPLSGQQGLSSQVIAVGDRVFIEDSSEPNVWRERGGGAVGPTLADIPEDVELVHMQEDESVNGVPAFHVTGRQTTANGGTFHWYVSKNDYRLVRLITEETYQNTVTTTISGTPTRQIVDARRKATFDYRDYDAPVSINVPQVISPG